MAVMFFGTMGFSLVWGIGFLASAICRMIVRPRDGKLLRWTWRWWRLPLSLALAAVLQFNGCVWYLRWWHARDSFSALRQEIRDTQKIPSLPRWVGTFYVKEITAMPGTPDPLYSVGKGIYYLGWPDSAYSDWSPAIVDYDGQAVAGWPLTTKVEPGWFFCMDPT